MGKLAFADQKYVHLFLEFVVIGIHNGFSALQTEVTKASGFHHQPE
jgi:hypothetical protein